MSTYRCANCGGPSGMYGHYSMDHFACDPADRARHEAEACERCKGFGEYADADNRRVYRCADCGGTGVTRVEVLPS